MVTNDEMLQIICGSVINFPRPCIVFSGTFDML